MSTITYLNPQDKPSGRYHRPNKIVLWAGEISPHYFVYFGHLEDGLDEMIDYLAEHAPGLLADEQVEEAYREYIEEHKAEYPDGENDEDLQEEARCEAEMDCTSGGNCGHYLLSWQWGIWCENPTRAEMKGLIADLEARNYSGKPVVQW